MEGVSPSIARAVARRLKYYIDVQRREEAFDRSGPEKPFGEFSSSNGGSYYNHNAEDKRLKYYMQQSHLKHHLEALGIPFQVSANVAQDEQKSEQHYQSMSECATSLNNVNIRTTKRHDNKKLLYTTAKILTAYSMKLSKKRKPCGPEDGVSQNVEAAQPPILTHNHHPPTSKLLFNTRSGSVTPLPPVANGFKHVIFEPAQVL